ncbi:1-phosphofructokinase family hexose kinase [Thiohalomonas denitrificans]|uniref:Phosphofructokinase n=1 Tax=Thiohalomonas denitrificans TaxID=415747 RepID=A0A1G5Q3Y4_9GAMM|nr:1-phosphofructokinase family hexose kinase [Thiohalomonas denitrificans]SCZ56170.1 6-phosphofructokinase 2 [Thiohalomonas denitrificans]
MSAIVTVTMNPAVDLSGTAERLLVGHKTRCGTQVREPGGGGINVAGGIHALGGDALALYAAGGPNGNELERLLKDRGLKQQRIAIEGDTRNDLAIQEKATGKLFHFVFSGPSLSEREWQHCLESVNTVEPVPDYLVLSGSLPPGVPADFYAYAARAATERGTRVILDSSGPALRPTLEAGVFLVKPNRKEFGQFGVPEDAGHEIYLDAMQEMVNDGLAQVVIVTLGSDGALLVSRAGDRLHLRPPPVEGISPVGAGDSFVAVLTHQLARGNSLVEAFRYGIAAAAAAVLTPGTQLYSSDAIEQMYRRMIE